MTNTEIKTAIVKALNTLNVVEVKGKNNMNHLLGVILTLEELVNKIDEPEIKIEEVSSDEQTR